MLSVARKSFISDMRSLRNESESEETSSQWSQSRTRTTKVIRSQSRSCKTIGRRCQLHNPGIWTTLWSLIQVKRNGYEVRF